jgi:hypothetical protein
MIIEVEMFRLFKKKNKEVANTIFDYFKFDHKDSEGYTFLGDFKNKDFCHWLTFVHGQIQAILKSKLIDGNAIENYVNITLFLGGQRVDISIIKDGGKSPHELLQNIKGKK